MSPFNFQCSRDSVASRYFPLETHALSPTMSVPGPSNSWPTHGQFIFHSFHFLLQKTPFNCTTVEGEKRCLQIIKYYAFETASLYLMSWKLLIPTAPCSYCTWKSKIVFGVWAQTILKAQTPRFNLEDNSEAKGQLGLDVTFTTPNHTHMLSPSCLWWSLICCLRSTQLALTYKQIHAEQVGTICLSPVCQARC